MNRENSCTWLSIISLKKILRKQDFQSICPQSSNIKYILLQNQGTYNLGWPQQDHTQYNVQSLAKSDLCSMCN